MSEQCRWLHEQLGQLREFQYPINPGLLPESGIYFFYEKGETWGHGGSKPRIVRVGTARDGNFRKRISEHYLLDESKMNFDAGKPAPRERSIFRKNIGRALLNWRKDDYLGIWEIDFTSSQARRSKGHLRDIGKEKELESEVTRILRGDFSFRYIMLSSQAQRMGKKGLESRLIGTLAQCPLCQPSSEWLGRHSPKAKISNGKLWLEQHLKAKPINDHDKEVILAAASNNRE